MSRNDFLTDYLNSLYGINVLDSAEEYELAKKIQEGDDEALDKLNRIVIKQLLVSLTKRDVILAKHQSQMTERNLTVASLSRQLESYTKLITEIYDSSSWRITAPFRALSRLLHKIGNEK